MHDFEDYDDDDDDDDPCLGSFHQRFDEASTWVLKAIAPQRNQNASGPSAEAASGPHRPQGRGNASSPPAETASEHHAVRALPLKQRRGNMNFARFTFGLPD